MTSVTRRRSTLVGEPGERRPFVILVPLAGAPGQAFATVGSVLRHAAHPERLRVVGTVESLAAAGLRFQGLATGRVAAVEELEPGRLVAAALREEPRRDVIFLRPGVLVPPLFDLRLQWSVDSDPALGAVSPLCDVEPLTALRPHGVGAAGDVELDRLVSIAGDAAIDCPFLLPECFYLRGDEAAPLAPHGRDGGLPALAAELYRRGVPTALAPHVFVGSGTLAPRREPLLSGDIARVFLAETPARQVAALCRAAAASGVLPANVETRAEPRVLLAVHSLGGGLDHWTSLYSGGAAGHQPLILRSVGERGRFGSQLWLYDSATATAPIRVWKLAAPIADTVDHHLGYAQALREIVSDHGIEAVVVGSLIGHSLDVLRTGKKTVLVCHDYYPFCPALHIHYGTVCSSCSAERLRSCLGDNPLFEVFDDRDDRRWMDLRRRFLATLVDERVELVAPSASVVRHYRELAPELAGARFTVIPHGHGVGVGRAAPEPPPTPERPLRVAVLGRLSRAKGGELVRELVEILRGDPFAELFLLGAGAAWERSAPAGVTVVSDYDRGELPAILERFHPDVVLLVSIVPETFSFTLSECFDLAVPVVATRVGSFADRIVHGSTGFLCEPNVPDVVARLRKLHADRSLLDRVRAELRARPERTAREMVAEYAVVLQLPRWSASAYFSPWGRSGRDGRTADAFLLPPSSPLGLLDFLSQVEQGLVHHLRHTRFLRPWQKRILLPGVRGGFKAVRWSARFF